jgi:hypothetical protein
MDLTTPVLFLVFNRPDTTRRVFEAIRRARPSRLFIAADGPRRDREGEVDRCAEVRRIVGEVDWDCQVSTLFREENLGCRNAPSTALDWFFEQVEEGIVLEDDCLPSPSFFFFCQSLLEYYRHDTRIMQISGLNVLSQWNRTGHSYYFSSYGPCWGWASWRRAWKSYDVAMKLWPEIRDKGLYEDFCQCPAEAQYRCELYDRVYRGQIDTVWDYQWGFAKMINRGLSVIPVRNLVSNIGFSQDATHTVSGADSPYAEMATYQADTPLSHPPYVVRDALADRRYLEEFMLGKPPARSLKEKMLKLLGGGGR